MEPELKKSLDDSEWPNEPTACIFCNGGNLLVMGQSVITEEGNIFRECKCLNCGESTFF
jgi:hypothetical protein